MVPELIFIVPVVIFSSPFLITKLVLLNSIPSRLIVPVALYTKASVPVFVIVPPFKVEVPLSLASVGKVPALVKLPLNIFKIPLFLIAFDFSEEIEPPSKL